MPRQSKNRKTVLPAFTAEEQAEVENTMAIVKKIALQELATPFLDADGKPRPLRDLSEAESRQLALLPDGTVEMRSK